MHWGIRPEVKLWWWQQRTLKLGREIFQKYGFLWLQAGCATGKTLASIALAQQAGANKILVLTTVAAADDAWFKNVTEKTFGLKPVILNSGAVVDRAFELTKARHNDEPCIVVLNYEACATKARAKKGVTTKKTKELPILAQAIAAARFDFIIADESHKIKSAKGLISQELALACAGAKYRLAMTGTPFEDTPTDVFGQVRWLASGERPKHPKAYVPSRIYGNWTAFFERYVVYRLLGDGIKDPIGFKNIDELRQKFAGFTLQIKTEEVFSPEARIGDAPALPPHVTFIKEVEWQPKQKTLYTQLRTRKVAIGDAGAVTIGNPLTMSIRLREIVNGYYKPDGKDNVHRIYDRPLKVQAVIDIIDELGGEPVVIFTAFSEEVHMLEQHLRAEGYTDIKRLVGGVHEHNEFQRGEGQIIIVNLAAGAEGVELTRARYGIYYSLSESRTQFTQSLARIRRPGMDENLPVTYFILQVKNSVDKLIYDALLGKGDVATEVANGLTKV